MVVGIGIDITEIERVRKIYDRFGERFLSKILNPQEIAALPNDPLARVAGRFALKEAAVKALGVGFARGISPLDIHTCNDEAGKPEVTFRGEAEKLAESLGVVRIFASVSHERAYAAAMILLEN